MQVLWFLPTHGDGRYLGADEGARTVGYDYLRQVAAAADALGYDGMLLPTGRSCEDAWVAASSLIGATGTLKFLVAVRPGICSPGLAARMAASFDRLSRGRLMINVVTGGDSAELEGDGLLADHDTRYQITDEFLEIWRSVLAAAHDGRAIDFNGRHLVSKQGKVFFPPVQKPYPPLYFGGSSPPAREIAARQADVYLTWGEPPSAVAEKIADLRERASRYGRTLRFGIRLHVIVRDTAERAWRDAEELISRVDDATIEKAQAALGRMDSEGQRRMVALLARPPETSGEQGRRRLLERLEVAPNLWAGVALVRGGAGTALVGDAKIVAARMREYADLGIETFILSGYPHLEEAYRFAELVFPLLPSRKRAESGHGPAGELIANEYSPRASQS